MTPEKIHAAARCLKALAHPLRLGILCSLKNGEMNVQQLENVLDTSQSNLSQHLANMRERNILTTRRQGNQVFYAVRDERLFALLETLQQLYCQPSADDEFE